MGGKTYAWNTYPNLDLLTVTGYNALGLHAPGVSFIDASMLSPSIASHYIVYNSAEISNIPNNTVVDIVDVTTVNSMYYVGLSSPVGSLLATTTVNLNTDPTAMGISLWQLNVSGVPGTIGSTGTIHLVANGASVDSIELFATAPGANVILTGSGSGLSINSWSTQTLNSTGPDSFDASGYSGTVTLGNSANNSMAAGDSGYGDTIKFGSGTTKLALGIINGHGITISDSIVLLAGHTAVDTIDFSEYDGYIIGFPFSSVAAQDTAITKITNFNTGLTASDILMFGTGNTFRWDNVNQQDVPAVAIPGSVADINTNGSGHVWANAGAGFVTMTGATASTFLSDVYTSQAFTAGHVIAFNDGVNTYVAIFDSNTYNLLTGFDHVIELVGVHTATAVGLAAGANTIHIA